jgi:DNA replication protein DnaC
MLTASDITRNLTNKISDADFVRLEKTYPVSGKCPTCGDTGVYTLDFVSHSCDCTTQKLLARNYYAANIGREYHGLCIDDFFGEATKLGEIVKVYVDKFEDNYHYGTGLTFMGPYGTGKTMALMIALKEIIKRGRSAYFTTFGDLIAVWGSSWQDDESKRILSTKLRTVDLLGIDELRTDKRNEGGFLADGLDAIIRARTSNNLPTLVTTNMDDKQQENQFAKVYSLLSAKNEVVQTHGRDKRRDEVRKVNIERRERGERVPVC